MQTLEIERLLTMLNPSCDIKTFYFVRDSLVEGFAKPQPGDRTDQQKVDVYDGHLANDPIHW